MPLEKVSQDFRLGDCVAIGREDYKSVDAALLVPPRGPVAIGALRSRRS